MFVDRHNELAFLNSLLTRERPGPAQLVLLYGRRRVGKTELLLHWAKNSGVDFTYWLKGMCLVKKGVGNDVWQGNCLAEFDSKQPYYYGASDCLDSIKSLENYDNLDSLSCLRYVEQSKSDYEQVAAPEGFFIIEDESGSKYITLIGRGSQYPGFVVIRIDEKWIDFHSAGIVIQRPLQVSHFSACEAAIIICFSIARTYF